MQEATFHVDHVEPQSAAGPTTFGNLALACVSCSLRKGARTLAVDPTTGEETRLFNPRVDDWNARFEVTSDCEIQGRSAVARATVALLQMNRAIAIAIRHEEKLRSRWP